MARPILVTGPQGFAGSVLLAQLGERALPTEVDVTDAASLADAVRAAAPGAIVHLAAISSVTASTEDPGEAWRVNVVGAVNLLEAARAHAPDARILMVSTGEVYGRAEQVPTPEDAPIAPISQYAASKAAVELACGLAQALRARGRRRPRVSARGPGRDERFAVGSWTAQIARAEEAGGGTVLVGDLSSKRDITDVRDICRAYELLLDPSVPAETYNVASGRVVELGEVLDLLVGMARCPIQVEPDPARSRPSDLTVISGDPSRLHAATGWTPTIPLEQTLADALDFARHAAAERMAST